MRSHKRYSRHDIDPSLYSVATVIWVGLLVFFGYTFSTVNVSMTNIVITQYRQWKYTVEGSYLQNQNVQFQPQYQYSLFHRQLLEAEEDSAAKFKQSIPRYNLEGQRVNSTFQPTSLDYYESLIIMAIPFVVLSFLSCCVGIFFFVLRQCCNTCGGKECKEDGYTVKQRLIPKYMIIAIGLIVIVCSILGWIGNGNFSKGLNEFFDVVINTTTKIIDVSASISIKLQQVQSLDTQSVEASVATVRDASEQFREIAQNAQDTVNKYNKYREIVIQFGYVLAMVTSVIGVVGAFLNKGKLCLIMAILGFASLTFLFLSCGFHFPTSVVLGDFCEAINEYIDENENSNNGTTVSNSTVTTSGNGLDSILKCLSQDNYASIYDVAYSGLDNSLNRINNFTVLCCNVSFTYENITAFNASEFPEEIRPQIQRDVNDFKLFQAILEDLKLLTSCVFIKEAYEGLKHALCSIMLGGIDMIFGTQALIALIFLPGVYVAILAWKRLGNPNGDYYGDDDYYEDYETNNKNQNH